MNNKPKYNLFKNAKYAINGLICAIKTETSFKLELIAGIFILPLIFIIDIELSLKLMLLLTAFLVIIAELLNSAIENIVDLVTNDFHLLAKNAKDISAAAVLFSLILHILCWILVLKDIYIV